MSTREVYLIYVPFLNSRMYYVANEEWSFEPREARYFNSEEYAQQHINRLKEHEKRALYMHSINPEKLAIECSEQPGEDHLSFSYTC